MSWKHWPYWLKGGVIGVVVGTILDIPPILCYLSIGGFFCINISPMIFAGFFTELFPSISYAHPILFLTVTSIVLSLLLGSLIGAIVGHFQSKRKRLS